MANRCTPISLRLFIGLWLSLLLIARAHSASAEPRADSADEYMKRGLTHYHDRNFEAAINDFRIGYAVDPRPEFLFAVAQAERRSGDCASALIYYRRFLATEPSARQVDAARMHIASCQRALATGPGKRKKHAASTPASQTPDNTTHSDPPTISLAPQPIHQHESTPWYRDTAGSALLGLGVTSTVASVGLLWSAHASSERASHATTYPQYAREFDRTRRHQLWGAMTLGLGASLIAGSLWRFHNLDDNEADSAYRGLNGVSIATTPTSLSVTLGGHF